MNSLKFFFIILLTSLLTGCGPIGDKSFSLLAIYSVTAVLAIALLFLYLRLFPRKNPWFLLLFSSIAIVNTGYLMLASSKTLEFALWANRISYLGSAMLPLSMLMIIFQACKLRYRKWMPYFFFGISFIIFLIAASPGYLTIYYQEVSLEILHGISILKKIYGPWHSVYLFYLIIYFSIMVAAIIYATKKKLILSNIHAIILALAVFVNIGVWLLEQLVEVDFELLSVSYIICGLFLLALHILIYDNETILAEIKEQLEKHFQTEKQTVHAPVSFDISDSQYQFFEEQLCTLTPTERIVYDLYLNGKTPKEILEELNIKENTLKYHNRNIYSKLGVSSRKQLLQIGSTLETYQKSKTI